MPRDFDGQNQVILLYDPPHKPLPHTARAGLILLESGAASAKKTRTTQKKRQAKKLWCYLKHTISCLPLMLRGSSKWENIT